MNEAPDASEHGEDLGIMRSLVDRVTVMPATNQSGLSIELEGDIVAMIGLALNTENGRKHTFSAADHASFCCSVKMVAGTRCHLYRTTLRTA